MLAASLSHMKPVLGSRGPAKPYCTETGQAQANPVHGQLDCFVELFPSPLLKQLEDGNPDVLSTIVPAAWLTHPDERVIVAALRRPEVQQQISDEEFADLLWRAIDSAATRGLLWTPLIDALDTVAEEDLVGDTVDLGKAFAAVGLLHDRLAAWIHSYCTPEDTAQLLSYHSPRIRLHLSKHARGLDLASNPCLLDVGYVDALARNPFLSQQSRRVLLNHLVDVLVRPAESEPFAFLEVVLVLHRLVVDDLLMPCTRQLDAILQQFNEILGRIPYPDYRGLIPEIIAASAAHHSSELLAHPDLLAKVFAIDPSVALDACEWLAAGTP